MPNFRILSQAVAEKSLTEKGHMYFTGVTEGKNENLKKEGKVRIDVLIFYLHNTLFLPEGVHKI